eukprot:SAG11_NODE_9484_length_907_cov_1.450495_1_plen_92_part_00
MQHAQYDSRYYIYGRVHIPRRDPARAPHTKYPGRQCRIVSRLLGMQNRQTDRRKGAFSGFDSHLGEGGSREFERQAGIQLGIGTQLRCRRE